MAYLVVLQQLVEVAQTVERLSNRNKKVRCENKQIGREAGKHYRVPYSSTSDRHYVPQRTRQYNISQQHTHANTDWMPFVEVRCAHLTSCGNGIGVKMPRA